MERELKSATNQSPGAWAKKCHQASRNLMERMLKPYGLGTTQWYVMHHLANNGPTAQRDLLRTLEIEKATLSGVLAALLRKELVSQKPDPEDLRQRILDLTDSGQRVWQSVPDPIMAIRKIAFVGIDQSELEIAARVLRTATERMNRFDDKGGAK